MPTLSRHLAVLLVLLGIGYLAVRFGGVAGKYMTAIPAIFIIYLGVSVLLAKWRQRTPKSSPPVAKSKRKRR
jgi:threonine/homoserine/homoserine lactone efflux protein